MPMASPKTLYRTKLASATALAAASIGMLFLRVAKPKDEPIMHTERPHPSAALADDDCEPVKGDMRCEMRKGEADPLSITFDPESCGYCGDDIRQATAPEGAPPVLDLDSGILTQQVTERPSETPQSCPVDFHCGNGRRDFQRTYGSWLSPQTDAGPDTGYSIGTKTITESARDCPGDIRPNGNGGGDAASEVVEDAEPASVRQTSSVWDCPSIMIPSNSSDMVDMHSSSMWRALSRIHGAINNHAAELRRALGASENADVDVRFSIRVDPRGYLTLRDASAQCDSMPCGDAPAIINSTYLSLMGLAIGGPGVECFWGMTIRVPKQ